MTAPYLKEALLYLINAIFFIYILFVVLRFLLQVVRADPYNPISQFLLTITNPPLRPLRRIIPGFANIDWAAIVLMLALKAVELTLVDLITYGSLISFVALMLFSAADLLALIIHIFMFVIFVQIIISWLSPGLYHPVTVILYKLSEPLLRPARRYIPAINGLDFSPLLVFIFLQLSLILLVRPLSDLARSLTL